MRSSRVVVPVIVLLSSVSVACTHQPPAVPEAAPRSFERQIELNQHPLTLHLAPGTDAHPGQLLLYATGDGGWRGKDRDVYRQLESWGYATVGFSAPEYLRHLPAEDGTTTPAELASDFSSIIDAGRESLDAARTRAVILVGVSRGADLAVVAAGQPELQSELSGVVAMGLTREEEYIHHRRLPDIALELYTYLPSLGDVPVSVIQSTHDNYLAADEARELFGEDTPLRVFHPIEARNHSFAGARPLLYSTLRASLAWVDRIGHRKPPG